MDTQAEWVIVSTLSPTNGSNPILFAHRGARADARENTLEAFLLAKEKGATGMESDVWVTSDGVAVLDHDGVIGRGPWRKRISEMSRSELPDHIPSLAEYYAALGPGFDLSLDLKDPEAFEPMVAVARGAGAETKLWVCHHDVDYLISLREVTEARLVDSTSVGRMPDGAERRAARLSEAGVEAVNLRHGEWSKGLVTVFHRFGVLAFGWDAQRARELARLYSHGIDGVYSDHVDRMVATHRAFGASD